MTKDELIKALARRELEAADIPIRWEQLPPEYHAGIRQRVEREILPFFGEFVMTWLVENESDCPIGVGELVALWREEMG